MAQSNGKHTAQLQDIERQARLLAHENREAEPAIKKVLWFRDEKEVRLLEVDQTVPSTGDGVIRPVFFRPSPQDGLSAPSAIALIQPDEFGTAKLPPDWGEWKDAIEL